jgi:hypothetical protein
MAKEAVTLEIESGAILQAQRIACERNLTVKQWMEEAVKQAIANDSPAPTSRAVTPVTHRVLQ